MPPKRHNLVADIGGTHARFALVAEGDAELIEPRSLTVADYPRLADAALAYLEKTGLGEPARAAFSVASPVTGDLLDMTNHDWSFSVAETREALDLDYLKVLNDFTALALALTVLPDDQCFKLGPGEGVPGQPRAVLGPGTGLGVSGVVPSGDRWVPLEGEGGHVSYGPLDAREQQVIEVMREKLDHVSAESLVSGRGLANIYAALTRIDRGEAERLDPEEISALAVARESDLATEALSMFCGILGTVAGNLALTLGARGGVYIGGGIVPGIIDFFSGSKFRERFERHGRFTAYLHEIPTYVIVTGFPALSGALVSLGDAYRSLGISSRAGS
ncbi:MAG: glucokinase [Gammaproteobacteria bacterium]|jgi:glucokinase